MSKTCVLLLYERAIAEEGVGLEPTTVLPATYFQDKLLIQPDTFRLILSKMSMNYFCGEGETRTRNNTILVNFRFTKGIEPYPRFHNRVLYQFTTSPYFSLLIKDMNFILLFQLYYKKKLESFY